MNEFLSMCAQRTDLASFSCLAIGDHIEASSEKGLKLFIGEILEPSDTEFTLLADSQFVLIRTLWRDKKQSPENELSPLLFRSRKICIFSGQIYICFGYN